MKLKLPLPDEMNFICKRVYYDRVKWAEKDERGNEFNNQSIINPAS